MKFEKQIEEIIRKEFYREDEFRWENCAKEISAIAYPVAFVEWLFEGDHYFYSIRYKGSSTIWKSHSTGNVEYTLSELRDYWCDNVEGK